MISIDKIIPLIDDDRKEEGAGIYFFPTIDFKFQNTGGATAFLWQFAINIIQAEIDPTPCLYFFFNVDSGALKVYCENDGYGSAKNCELLINCDDRINEYLINRLFNDNERSFTGEILGGSRKEIIKLVPKKFTSDEFKEVCRDIYEERKQRFGPKYFNNSNIDRYLYGSAIRIEDLTIQCKYKDERGVTHNAIGQASNYKGLVFLTKDGFEYKESDGDEEDATSWITYTTIVDPKAGAHERKYPISRKIPPGDVERFHIMIGASMSCSLRTNFKFFVDKEKVIESEIFSIDIWNPRGSRWHEEYKDGAEVERVIRKIRKGSRADLDLQNIDLEMLKRELSHTESIRGLEGIKELILNYPFLY
jgi:hypothetical protein